MARVIKAEDVGRAQVARPVHVRRDDGSLAVVGEVVECRGVLILRRVTVPLPAQEGSDRDPER